MSEKDIFPSLFNIEKQSGMCYNIGKNPQREDKGYGRI